MIRKPSLFYEERRILAKYPYAAVIGVLLLLRILSSLPDQTIDNTLKKGPLKIIFGKLISKVLR